jgi:ribosomal protein S18 acetylase RimI-like enzyme
MLHIRRYRKSDEAAVRRLILDVWGKRWLDGVLYDFGRTEAFLAELDGSIVGAVTMIPGSFAWLIDELMVAKRWRKHGVGSTMLHFAIAYARKHGSRFMKVFVEKDNKTGLIIYKKFGFKRCGKIRNAFEPRDCYVYMCKFL